jgi:hypothetical protein
MTHYICKGCNRVFKNPGVCTDNNCPEYSEALDPCDCKEEKHLNKIEQNKLDLSQEDNEKDEK